MKLSILIESKEDFELILPFCEQISKVQKEGKYLFNRFICLCDLENHNTFKKCLKKYNINVPYTILEFEEEDLTQNNGVVLKQMEDEIFKNPVEAILMIGWNEINKGITELAVQYRIKIILVDSKESKEKIKGDNNYIFSTTDPNCWKNIVETIINIYKL